MYFFKVNYLQIKYLFLYILIFSFDIHCSSIAKFFKKCYSRQVRHAIKNNAIMSKPDYELLYDAIKEGNIAKISIMLLNNSNLANCQNLDTSPLCMAIIKQDLEMVKLFLENGADVNYTEVNYIELCDKHSLDNTPLMLACSYENSDIVSLLIDYKSQFNSIGDSVYGPLHRAIANGCINNIKILACRGIDLDFFNTDCYRAGADIADGQYFTNIPLCYACQFNNIEVVELLIEKVGIESVNTLDIIGFSPLHWASYIGNLDVVKLLINKYNADPELKIAGDMGLGKAYNGLSAFTVSKCRKLSKVISFFMNRKYLQRRSSGSSESREESQEFGFGID